MLLPLLYSLPFLHECLDRTQQCVDVRFKLSRELRTEGVLVICKGNKIKHELLAYLKHC